MYLADYHLHSINSPDGNDSVDAICQAAISAGLKEIAITDHVDIVKNPAFALPLDTEKMHQDITKAQQDYEGKLILRRGVELGQPQANPKDAQNYLDRYHHDFIIGSIHNLENDADVYYYDFTTLDRDAVYQQYIDCMQQMAEGYDFDVMGHLTYPLRYMFQCDGKVVDLKNYEGQFCTLFKTLIQRGKGIEVNVSGLSHPMKQTLPPLYLVKLYRQCGGEIITVGTDAHKTEKVGKGILEGQQLLKEAGFTHFTTYQNRKPSFVKIDL